MIVNPALSPSGDSVAFQVIRNDQSSAQLDIHLWILSLEDGTAKNTGARIGNRDPASWSNDGSQIVVVSLRPDNERGLDRIDVKTLSVSSIMNPTCYTPKHSPDGKHLGYILNNDLVVMDMQFGRAETLASEVDHSLWCWNADGSAVIFTRNSRTIHQKMLKDRSTRILYSCPDDEPNIEYPLRISPDGKYLGFKEKTKFRAIDLETGDVKDLFSADHYFFEVGWRGDEICYLDKVGDDRRNMAQLMVYNTQTGAIRTVASGLFSQISWVNDNNIFVRCGNDSFWLYDAKTGVGRQVFVLPK